MTGNSLHGSAHRGTLPQPVASQAPQKHAGHPPTRLSVVMPYYRKLAEFTRVLPLQHAWLARPDLEVILVMDAPDEEAGLLALLAVASLVWLAVSIVGRQKETANPASHGTALPRRP